MFSFTNRHFGKITLLIVNILSSLVIELASWIEKLVEKNYFSLSKKMW